MKFESYHNSRYHFTRERVKRDGKFTGSGFLRGTTSPANILIFSALSGPSKKLTIAETLNQGIDPSS